MMRKYSHLVLCVGLMFCVSADVVVMTSGCSGNKRGDTIHAMVVSVDAARDGFLAWNKQASEQIVADAKAKIPELGAPAARALAESKLAEHDKKVDDIISLFTATYRAAALAASKSDDRSLKDAIKAASELLDAVARVRGSP